MKGTEMTPHITTLAEQFAKSPGFQALLEEAAAKEIADSEASRQELLGKLAEIESRLPHLEATLADQREKLDLARKAYEQEGAITRDAERNLEELRRQWRALIKELKQSGDGAVDHAIRRLQLQLQDAEAAILRAERALKPRIPFVGAPYAAPPKQETATAASIQLSALRPYVDQLKASLAGLAELRHSGASQHEIENRAAHYLNLAELSAKENA